MSLIKNKNIKLVKGIDVGEAVATLKQQNLRALNFIEMIQQCMSMLFMGEFYNSATLLAFYGDWLIVDHRPNNPLLQSETYTAGWWNRLIYGAMLLTQDYFDSALQVANSGSELVFVVPRSEAMKANGEHTLKDAAELVLLSALCGGKENVEKFLQARSEAMKAFGEHSLKSAAELVVLSAVCGGKENAEKFLQDHHKQTDKEMIRISVLEKDFKWNWEKDFKWERIVGRMACFNLNDDIDCVEYLSYSARFLGIALA